MRLSARFTILGACLLTAACKSPVAPTPSALQGGGDTHYSFGGGGGGHDGRDGRDGRDGVDRTKTVYRDHVVHDTTSATSKKPADRVGTADAPRPPDPAKEDLSHGLPLAGAPGQSSDLAPRGSGGFQDPNQNPATNGNPGLPAGAGSETPRTDPGAPQARASEPGAAGSHDPEGIAAISRGLSEATPPVATPNNSPDPGGVADASRIADPALIKPHIAQFAEVAPRGSGAVGDFHDPIALAGAGTPAGVRNESVALNPGVSPAQPPANGLRPSGVTGNAGLPAGANSDALHNDSLNATNNLNTAASRTPSTSASEPGGFTAISRGLSEATPPVAVTNNLPDPGGVADASRPVGVRIGTPANGATTARASDTASIEVASAAQIKPHIAQFAELAPRSGAASSNAATQYTGVLVGAGSQRSATRNADRANVEVGPSGISAQQQPASSIPLPPGLRGTTGKTGVTTTAFDGFHIRPTTPPPVPLWSQLGVEPLRPAPKTLSREQAMGTVRNSKSSHIAVWTPAQPNGVTLPRAEAMRKIENSGESAFLIIPLPGEDAAKWQPIIDQTTAALALADWLGDPETDDAWRREWAARRNEYLEADRDGRERLNQAFFNVLLTGRTAAPTPAAATATRKP